MRNWASSASLPAMARSRTDRPGRESNRPAHRGPAVVRHDHGLGCRLAAGLPLQALLEPLDLAGGVDDVLGAGEEGMAVAADVDAQLGSGGPHGPLGAARAAMDLGFVILGMDIGLHGFVLLRRRPRRAIAPPVVAGCFLGGRTA